MELRAARRAPWSWVGLASAFAFIALATLVVRRGGLAFDEPFATALQGLLVPVWFWGACTFLGGAVLIPIGVAFFLATAFSRRLKPALIIAVVLIAATLSRAARRREQITTTRAIRPTAYRRPSHPNRGMPGRPGKSTVVDEGSLDTC